MNEIQSSDIKFYTANTNGIEITGGDSSAGNDLSCYPRITKPFTATITNPAATAIINGPYNGRSSISGSKYFNNATNAIKVTASIPAVEIVTKDNASVTYSGGSILYTKSTDTVSVPSTSGTMTFSTMANSKYIKHSLSSFVSSNNGSIVTYIAVSANNIELTAGQKYTIPNDTGRISAYPISILIAFNNFTSFGNADHGSIIIYGDQDDASTELITIKIKRTGITINTMPSVVSVDGTSGNGNYSSAINAVSNWSLI